MKARVRKPRVLIVEPDPTVAINTVDECNRLGLEARICPGAGANLVCPGLAGKPCVLSEDVDATLLTVDAAAQRIAAPACAGGRVILAGSRPLVGAATTTVLQPSLTIERDYSPQEAARSLRLLIAKARIEKLAEILRRVS